MMVSTICLHDDLQTEADWQELVPQIGIRKYIMETLYGSSGGKKCNLRKFTLCFARITFGLLLIAFVAAAIATSYTGWSKKTEMGNNGIQMWTGLGLWKICFCNDYPLCACYAIGQDMIPGLLL